MAAGAVMSEGTELPGYVQDVTGESRLFFVTFENDFGDPHCFF